MIAASSFGPEQIVALLGRLNRGETVPFAQEPDGPLAFTIEKTGRSFEVRDTRGRALASASTFAEAWRNRPRANAGATAATCGAADGSDTCAHDFRGWRAFEDGRGGEAVCTWCGLGAMAHTLRTGP